MMCSQTSHEFSNCRAGCRVAGLGVIGYSQFRDTLRRLNIDPTSESMRQILQKYDANGDGVIDYAEFVAALTEDCDAYQW